MDEGKQSDNLPGGQMTDNKQLSVEEQTSCLLSQTQSASGICGQLEQAAMKLSVNISFSPCIAKWNKSVPPTIILLGLTCCCSGPRWRKREQQSPSEAQSTRKTFICAAAHRSI